MASMASGFVAFGIHEVPHIGAWTMLLEAMRLDRIGKRAAHVVEDKYLWSHDEMWTVQASCEVVRCITLICLPIFQVEVFPYPALIAKEQTASDLPGE